MCKTPNFSLSQPQQVQQQQQQQQQSQTYPFFVSVQKQPTSTNAHHNTYPQYGQQLYPFNMNVGTGFQTAQPQQQQPSLQVSNYQQPMSMLPSPSFFACPQQEQQPQQYQYYQPQYFQPTVVQQERVGMPLFPSAPSVGQFLPQGLESLLGQTAQQQTTEKLVQSLLAQLNSNNKTAEKKLEEEPKVQALERPNLEEETSVFPLASAKFLSNLSKAVFKKRKRSSPSSAQKKSKTGQSNKRSKSAQVKESKQPNNVSQSDSGSESSGSVTSKYRGVSWHRRDRVWLARAWIEGKIKHLGCFKEEKMAALAVDLKLIELFGNGAKSLNFPDEATRNRLIGQYLEKGNAKLRRFVERAGVNVPELFHSFPQYSMTAPSPKSFASDAEVSSEAGSV